MLRLGQPRNDEVAEGRLNYGCNSVSHCEVLSEREGEKGLCVLTTCDSASSPHLPPTDAVEILRYIDTGATTPSAPSR